jgi:hypothetical protein
MRGVPARIAGTRCRLTLVVLLARAVRLARGAGMRVRWYSAGRRVVAVRRIVCSWRQNGELKELKCEKVFDG